MNILASILMILSSGSGDYLADARSMQADGTKMLVQIVVYDLPDRDCHAKASNGEYHIAQNGVALYKAYIDAIKSWVVRK